MKSILVSDSLGGVLFDVKTACEEGHSKAPVTFNASKARAELRAKLIELAALAASWCEAIDRDEANFSEREMASISSTLADLTMPPHAPRTPLERHRMQLDLSMRCNARDGRGRRRCILARHDGEGHEFRPMIHAGYCQYPKAECTCLAPASGVPRARKNP